MDAYSARNRTVCASVGLLAVLASHAAHAASPPAARASLPLTGEEAGALARAVADRVGAALGESRDLLVGPGAIRTGPRPPTPRPGQVLYPGSPVGGVGRRLTWFLVHHNPKSGDLDDYRWSQTDLRAHLEGVRARNREALADAEALYRAAARLAAGLDGWQDVPPAFRPPEGTGSGWPGLCLASLREAADEGHAARCRLWAAELAATLFALADLHRWVDFLAANHLEALDYQRRCEAMFASVERTGELADPLSRWGDLPAGRQVRCTLENFLEVERQARGLVEVRPEDVGLTLMGRVAPVAVPPADVPAARWVPPHLRGPFIELRSRLSPANRRVWDQAAHTPFERSYLVNMLESAGLSRALDPMGTVLERFSARTPQATVPELMDVIFYRGGDLNGGAYDRADRYDPRLMAAAGRLDDDPARALLAAGRFTQGVFGGWHNYEKVDTLRECLDRRKLVCTRATDMIGSLYRNAGHTGFVSVRWCGGKRAHSVAAARVVGDGRPAVVLVDGLQTRSPVLGVWPDAYLHGALWPEGIVGETPDVYTTELYVRGLDNYLWAEGYVIRGPHAGTLARTAVPYLPDRQRRGVTRVFDAGPPAGAGGPGRG